MFPVILSAISNALEPGASFFDKQVWEKAWEFFSDYSFPGVGIYIAAIVIVSQFYVEVSENIGHGVLTNFFQSDALNPKQPKWSQAFSMDDGETWEWNWEMPLSKME